MAIRLLSSESVDGALTIGGALTGTSATFSGNIYLADDEALNFGTSNAFNLRWNSTGASGQGASIIDSNRIFIETNFFQLNSRSGTPRLTISGSTSTFAGDVTVSGTSTLNGGLKVVGPGSYNTIRSGNNYTLGFLDSNGTTQWWIKAYTNGGFALHENGVGDQFTIAAGGAATFAGTVTGTIARFDTLNNNANSANIIYRSGTDTIIGGGSSSQKLTIADSGLATFAGGITATGSATFGNTQINGTLGVSSNINTSGILTANAINTNAYLADGTAADLHGRYLGQAIYGSGTGSGDNYGTVADVLRYKDIAIWRKNSSTNAWSNPSDGDALVNGNYAHSWGGYNMDSAYSEYVFYFSNTLGYSFVSQTIIQHSTNGNSFNLYIERASSTTNPYDTTGWTTMVTQTGISSWPGITCNQSTWEVGGGYPGLFRIRLVPTWNNGNVINIGSFQGYGSYGSFSHAWSTLFDRSVNFQSKIGVGTNPSRALDVTQEALIQGAGNVNMGTLALGPRASGVGKWSTISGAHYNQSSGGGNGSGAAGIMMIGTYGSNGENDIYVGGGPYEMNAATNIRFYTHTTDTSTAGGSIRMGISSAGRVTIGTTVVADAMCTIAGNSSNYALNLYADSIYSGIYRYQRFRSGSNIAGGIEGSNQTSVQYVTTSDYRTKKNIKPLENGLDRVCRLKPVKFDWKLNNETTEGFIAHEVQDIFPEAVSGEKDGEDMQGMDYGRITPLLVAAIQELKAEVEELKKQIK